MRRSAQYRSNGQDKYFGNSWSVFNNSVVGRVMVMIRVTVIMGRMMVIVGVRFEQ